MPTTSTLLLPPHPPQQNTLDSKLAARVEALEQKLVAFEQKSKNLNNTTQNLRSKVFNLELQDLPYKIDQTVNTVVKEAVHKALQAPLRDRFRELLEADMKKILHQRMFESGSYKLLPEHVVLYEALEASMDRENRDEFLAKIDKSRKRRRDDQDLPPLPPDNVNISNSKDTDTLHLPNISLQFQMEAYHRMLTDQVDLVNPEGHRIDLEYLVTSDKGRRSSLSISKMKAAHYLDFGLKELVSSLWIESERGYEISAAYGISQWWFKRKEFYINRHDAPSDRSKVRSYIRILCVISLKTYVRYGYVFLKEIVLCRDDYKEYKISEADFKNLHPNDFEDLYQLHLQGQLNHLSRDDKVYLFNTVNMWIRNIVIRKRVEDLQLRIESYQTKLNLTQPDWDASDFLFEEDYTIVSDGMLNMIIEKLDHMVKDFRLFKYNLSMTTRIWSEDDRRRSKEFMEVIEHRLKLQRIFRSLESFNIQVIPKYHIEDGNPARANIKQALGRSVLTGSRGSSKDGDGDTSFSGVYFITACSYSTDTSKELMKSQVMLGIKCSKAFPLPVMKIPLLEYFATVSAKEFPLLSSRSNSWEQQVVSELVEKFDQKKNNTQTLSFPHNLKTRSEMDLPNPTFAKTLILDIGKAPQEETGKGPASESSTKKKGRTIVITIKDMKKRRNDVKARITLLLALPDEHQLRFRKYETAKELWEVILKTFDGNEATKKTKKNQLKQQYGKFKAEGSKTLEQTFNRLEKGEVHTASVLTASTQVSTTSTDVAAASISHDTVCAYIASQSNGSQIKYEDITQIDKDDIKEIDIKWNMALLSMRADRECRAPRSQDRGRRESYKQGPKEEEPAPKALMTIDGLDRIGVTWPMRKRTML
uniref:Xylulose kinase-1 n=1 Tax=Tanacetum cinerariifolium TaxID=118510 RepID=A0A6L2L856_TANCI|nr:xylulose kinase-1 [Tanacetum cinerariifolium]